MNINTIGLITYHYPHLKTEQIASRLVDLNYKLRFFSLPFSPRKQRSIAFQHRPDQSSGVHPEVFARKHGIEYQTVNSDLEIPDDCDVYLVLGAGILSAECVSNKRIINCHPGVIPASRGLDSFKWAILQNKPLGITLHYIDAAVDAGDLISVIPTPVYEGDTIHSLARRHYEIEINCMVEFEQHMNNPENKFADIETGDAMRRMPIETEHEMIASVPSYIAKFSGTD